MQPYTANDLAKRIGNVLGLSPLGVAGSALDLIDATHRGDPPGVITAAAGMMPGAKGVAGGVAEGAGAGLGRAVPIKDLHLLHAPETIGSRPDLARLSDKELLQSVINPKRYDLVKIDTDSGKLVDGNSRVFELQKRAANPASSITPDTRIPIVPYTKINLCSMSRELEQKMEEERLIYGVLYRGLLEIRMAAHENNSKIGFPLG